MFEEKYFEEAYRLAERGRGRCGINPFVGAVLVRNNTIVGKGYTQECGKNHAEIEAITDAGKEAKGADLYVTLEPCCHQGKTPPCTTAIIKAGIERVYAGISDPNPVVNGKGFAELKAAGIEVTYGFGQKKIAKQLEYYLTYRRENRPFIMMKNAVSLDGKIAAQSGDAKWISSPESREYGHALRREAGTVVTGIETLLNDNPLLNVRLKDATEPVLRLIMDSRLRIPLDSEIVKTAGEIPTIVFKSEEYSDKNKEEKLLGFNVGIESLPSENKEYLSLISLMEFACSKEIPTILVEAGTRLSSSFLRGELVDKIYYFIAPKIIGGGNTVFDNLNIEKMSQALHIEIDKMETVGPDLLIIGYPQYSRKPDNRD